MRYVNLSSVLTYRMVSTRVKKKYPSYSSLRGDGGRQPKLIYQRELNRLMKAKDILEKADSDMRHELTWTPVLWAMRLLETAKNEQKIKVCNITTAHAAHSMLFLIHFLSWTLLFHSKNHTNTTVLY